MTKQELLKKNAAIAAERERRRLAEGCARKAEGRVAPVEEEEEEEERSKRDESIIEHSDANSSANKRKPSAKKGGRKPKGRAYLVVDGIGIEEEGRQNEGADDSIGSTDGIKD